MPESPHPNDTRNDTGSLIRKALRVNIISTLKANLRAGSLRRPAVIVLDRCSFTVKKGAKILCAPGSLAVLNDKWYGRNFTGSTYCLWPGGTLCLKGQVRIYRNADISVSPGGILSLDGTKININAQIHCANRISIGEGTMIGEGVRIRDHDVHRILRDGVTMPADAPIVIGRNVWIGINVTILKGVTIGEGAIISSHSLVTRDIPPHTLAGGVPARPIRENVEWIR